MIGAVPTVRMTYAMSSAVEQKLREGGALLRRAARLFALVSAASVVVVGVGIGLAARNAGAGLLAGGVAAALIALPIALVVLRARQRFVTERAALRRGEVAVDRRAVVALRQRKDRLHQDEFWVVAEGSPPLRFEVGSREALDAWRVGEYSTFVHLPGSRWLLVALDDAGRVIYHADQYDPAADPRWADWLEWRRAAR
ncbi:MAG: hypothetical protein RMM58_10750 [Chloroflexota bacterium]|nr:hypothetical protein [Dehalococcoidia bacterium]MDW8254344.1 hypothetical protein [Chloroflexota bacterium]